MLDTDHFTDLEIIAMTLIGESEGLGEEGMTGTALTLVNRTKANLHWLGGNTLRGVCLQKDQYDVWWPATNNSDRDRVIMVADKNPVYGPYIMALGIAGDALNNRLPDVTKGAVSYFDPPADPYWAKGKTPCYVEGTRRYFDLKAIT